MQTFEKELSTKGKHSPEKIDRPGDNIDNSLKNRQARENIDTREKNMTSCEQRSETVVARQKKRPLAHMGRDLWFFLLKTIFPENVQEMKNPLESLGMAICGGCCLASLFLST